MVQYGSVHMFQSKLCLLIIVDGRSFTYGEIKVDLGLVWSSLVLKSTSRRQMLGWQRWCDRRCPEDFAALAAL